MTTQSDPEAVKIAKEIDRYLAEIEKAREMFPESEGIAEYAAMAPKLRELRAMFDAAGGVAK